MQIHPTVYYGVQVIILICVVIIAGVVSYFVFYSSIDSTATDSSRKTDIIRMQTNAEVYFSRLRFYDGVCDDIGADEVRRCHDSETGFAIETKLLDGTYYCADSTGAPPVVLEQSKGNKTSCK